MIHLHRCNARNARTKDQDSFGSWFFFDWTMKHFGNQKNWMPHDKQLMDCYGPDFCARSKKNGMENNRAELAIAQTHKVMLFSTIEKNEYPQLRMRRSEKNTHEKKIVSYTKFIVCAILLVRATWKERKERCTGRWRKYTQTHSIVSVGRVFCVICSYISYRPIIK